MTKIVVTWWCSIRFGKDCFFAKNDDEIVQMKGRLGLRLIQSLGRKEGALENKKPDLCGIGFKSEFKWNYSCEVGV
ncbi:hypothetical protein DOM22_10320 [Bdellovibrio sp. ZAP7]|nr:hypothetical protein DOM22_10320 [Bdellovibrio sp. ZAP7]